jgi:hypothetical protein
MPPLTGTPHEAAPEVSNVVPLDQMRLATLDLDVNIHQLLLRSRADLQAVNEAIQALELIARESRPKGRPRSSTVPAAKTRNVVEIHTRREL